MTSSNCPKNCLINYEQKSNRKPEEDISIEEKYKAIHEPVGMKIMATLFVESMDAFF
jgi:hypothetical protein